MRIIEEGTSAWLSGLMLIAGGAAALYVGDIYLKSLGVVSLIAGPLFIYLDWRISKDLAAGDEAMPNTLVPKQQPVADLALVILTWGERLGRSLATRWRERR